MLNIGSSSCNFTLEDVSCNEAAAGSWPSAAMSDDELKTCLAAYFERLGWFLQKSSEVDADWFKWEFPEMCVVSTLDFDNSSAFIGFESLSLFRMHWESAGQTYLRFDFIERTLKLLFLSSGEEARHSLRGWAQGVGDLPPEAVLAIQKYKSPSDWSERVIHLHPKWLVPPPDQWQRLQQEIREFIASVEGQELSQNLPKSERVVNAIERL